MTVRTARLRAGAALRLACVLLLASQPGRSAATDLPRAGDLKREAGPGQPLLVLYARADCSWCEQARLYLAPMAREQANAAVYRQIDLDSDAGLKDFQGRATTHRAFAVAEGLRFTPTVVAYGPGGKRLADPVVGMGLPDFYGGTLQRVLSQARQRLGLPEIPPAGDTP